MSVVEEIRQAAALMRARAQAATPGPWDTVRRSTYPSVEAVNGHLVMETVVCDDETYGDKTMPDAEHIASWNPAVALAVADLLDHVADVHARFEQITTGLEYRAATVPDRLMVAVVRAYLGDAQ